MDSDRLQRVLEELHFSANLPEEIVHDLANACRMERAAGGELLFREGSGNEKLYLIHTGRIALEMNIPSQGAVRILTLGPGEMAGWSALLSHGAMTAAAVAVQDSTLVVAEAEQIMTLCQANPNFGYHLMRRMAEAISRRLVATRLQLLDLFASDESMISRRDERE